MSFFSRLSALALALAATTGLASASTLTLDSYGSVNSTNNATAGVGAGNTALTYFGYVAPGSSTIVGSSSNATYNLPTASPWAGIAGTNSSWVSFNPGNYPGGSNVAANGTYIYMTTFVASSTSTGTISVLADDTTSVYLNSTLITAAAAPQAAVNCTVGKPNCVSATTYNLAGFLTGTNTLSFGVVQNFGSGTGVDFAGTVNTAATPEPSSLILLGTGILGAAGAARRRFLA